MKADGIRAWCCMVSDCEFLEPRPGECPEHHVPTVCLILIPKPVKK